jgi:hypothetical protein
MTPRANRPAPDPRHLLVKDLLEGYWRRENPRVPTLPWGAGDAGALASFLRANPDLTVDVVSTCLGHRLTSEDHAPGERVYRWVGDLLRYSQGPLNRFKQPLRGSAEPGVGSYQPGKRYVPEEMQEGPLRALMSAEWQEHAVQQHAAGSHELSDLQMRFLKEENLL